MRSLTHRAAASVILIVAAPAVAQPSQINLPAGDLAESMLTLGRQARISIALGDPRLASIRVPAVRGRMTVEQALTQLLAGTAARFVAISPNAYRIVRAGRLVVRPAAPRRSERRETRPPATPAEDEIVVTASKRQTPLRDYAGSAVVISGADQPLSSASGGTDAVANQIAALGSTHLGPGRDRLFIRAIADSSFNGQTQATVGQYLGEARLNYNAPDPNLRLYDIQSIELLPGPQGTLYGAGTIGGVLRVTPNAPDTTAFAGALQLSGATTAHGAPSDELAGVLNVPLARDRAAARLVGYALTDGGYIDDIGRDRKDVNRTNIVGGRAAIRVEVAPEVTIDVSGAAQRIAARDSQYAETENGRLRRDTHVAQPFRNSFALGNLLLQAGFGQTKLTATATVADQTLSEDFDATAEGDEPEVFRQRNRAQLISGELRLSHGSGLGLSWLAGVSLVHNKRHLDRAKGPPHLLTNGPTLDNDLDEQTGFAELTLPITTTIKLTGGARLTHVRLAGRADENGELAASAKMRSAAREWQFLPSLRVTAKVSGTAHFYARYQEGVRPGGLILAAGNVQRLKSDHVASWEAGIRSSTILSAPVSASLSATYARWRDVQADFIDNTGFPSTLNLGDGDIVTLDGQIDARVARGLKVGLSGVFNKSRVTNPDVNIGILVPHGPLPNVPKFSARAGFDYTAEIGDRFDFRLIGWGRYVGRSLLGIGPNLGRPQGNYLDTGIEAQVGRGRFSTFMSVTNLFDAAGNRFAFGSIPVVGEQTTPMRPRTIRVGVAASF